MAKALFILTVIASVLALSMGQYGDLPVASTTSVSIQTPLEIVGSYLTMVEGFVTSVFQSLSEIKSLINDLLSQGPDVITYLAANWQKVLQQQIALIACLAAGILFIVVTLFGALLMCACRCCCNKCGGERKQSRKRSRSKWRRRIAAGLLLTSILILTPSVIWILMNDQVNRVATDLPTQTSDLLQNVIIFAENTNSQLDYVVAQFDVFIGRILAEVRNFEVKTTIYQQVTMIQEPPLSKLTTLNGYLSDINVTAVSYNEERQNLIDRQNTVEPLLVDLQSTAFGVVNRLDCTSDPNCLAARDIIIATNWPNNFNSALDNTTEVIAFLESYNSTCTQLLIETPTASEQGLNSSLDSAIDANFINDLVDDFNTTLQSTRSTLATQVNGIEVFGEIENLVNGWKSQITSILTTYLNQIEIYRWIGGIVFAAFFMIIVAFYWGGVIFGECSTLAKTNPTKRSGCSNFSGILIMIGAGISLIFAWLFMLACTAMFLLGGAVERYGCQGLQPPYELLQSLDSFTGNLLPFGNTTLTHFITSCQSNSGFLTAINSPDLVNITDIRTQVDDTVMSQSVDISLTYTPTFSSSAVNNCLSLLGTEPSLMTNLTDVSDSELNLTSIADSLQLLVDAGVGSDDNKNAIDSYISGIRQLVVDNNLDNFLLPSISTLIEDYNTLRVSITATASELATELPAANAQVSNSLSSIISQEVTALRSGLSNIAVQFLNWIQTQIEQNLGACGPLYQIYADLISVVCDQFVNLLNGFWFALGWATFFLATAVIFALKSTKFYRRMKVSDREPTPPTNVEVLGLRPRKENVRPKIRRKQNKVAPSPLDF